MTDNQAQGFPPSRRSRAATPARRRVRAQTAGQPPAAPATRTVAARATVQRMHGCLGVVFVLRRRDTGGVVHQYATEGAALAFVRDVLHVGGREQAAGFVLDQRDETGQTHTLAEGADLVRRALEDRAE